MSDRVREAFAALLEEMEEPPAWQDIRVHEARPQPALRRYRPIWVAAAAFVAVLAFGAVGILRSNTEPASVTVPYVQLDWSNQVEMRCEGMDIVDNGGFETATIEIWGPTADNIFRVDATAPDGTVETLVVHMNETSRPVEAWASNEDSSESVFRVAECTTSSASSSESISMADPPIHPRPGLFPQEFVGFPFRLADGTPVDLSDFLSANFDSQREDTWRGLPVTVFTNSDQFTDEFGTNDRTEEIWVDLDNRRYERHLIDYDIEALGHFVLTIETVDRSDATVDPDFLSTDGLILTHDRTGADDTADPQVNTTLSDR